MNLDDPAADVPGLRIPGNVIADFKAFSHLTLPNAHLRYPVQQIAALACKYSGVRGAIRKRWSIRHAVRCPLGSNFDHDLVSPQERQRPRRVVESVGRRRERLQILGAQINLQLVSVTLKAVLPRHAGTADHSETFSFDFLKLDRRVLGLR